MNQFCIFGGSLFAQPPTPPWHTNQTQYQGNFLKRQHTEWILYTWSLGIEWWSKKMIKYYVTKKACISTLTRIIYTECIIMVIPTHNSTFFNESLQKTTKESHPAVFGNIFNIIVLKDLFCRSTRCLENFQLIDFWVIDQ